MKTGAFTEPTDMSGFNEVPAVFQEIPHQDQSPHRAMFSSFALEPYSSDTTAPDYLDH